LDAGDVATMTLRFIADTTHFQATKLDVLENGLIEGCGAAIVEWDGENVAVEQIRWEEFFYDPRSRRPDFKDARYMGVAKWMYADDVAALYPGVAEAMADFQSRGAISGASENTWEDRPNTNTPWVDGKQRRVMVVDMYHQSKAKWWRCVFFAGGVLEVQVSPYKDDKGRPTNPIEGWSCYVRGGGSNQTSNGSANDRYGIVKGMRDLQDEINMRYSKGLHEVNSRQVQRVDPGAPPVDIETVRREAARPDGVIPSGWQIVPRPDVSTGNFEMLALSKAEFERMAPSPSVLGRETRDLSGRAQQINAQAGMTELAPVLGRFSDFDLRCNRQMWSRARQFYTDAKWVRVTDDLGAPQYVQINEPVIGPMGQPAQMKNHIAEMDVDIILDEVPDTATLDQEVWAELMDLLKAYPPGTIPFETAVEMSPISKKREIIQKIEAQKEAAAPQQQMAMQAQMAKFQAELEEIKSTIRKNDSQSDLNEANTVATAMKAHLEVNRAVQLPPGVTVNNSGTPVPVTPPPPGATGANGRKANGPPPNGR
jgi:hypothetical protein